MATELSKSLFVQEMREVMQEYVEESDNNINLKTDDGRSFVLPLEFAGVLFNDLLLYCNDGTELEKKVEVLRND